MKSNLLNKIKYSARDGLCRLFYVDEAGFCASPPVQYGWSTRGNPHRLDYQDNKLHQMVVKGSVTRATVVDFLGQLATTCNDGKPTFVILDNATIHHNIEKEHLDEWLYKHHMWLIYLPAYSPELNLIEMVWREVKYRWQRFVAWSKVTFESDLKTLLASYANKFIVNFS
ncbi:MAG: transposase [Aeromonas sp.]